MNPRLFDLVPSYLAAWFFAAVSCVVVGAFIMSKTGGDLRLRRVATGLTLFAMVLAGAKLLYFVEASLLPHEDYVPEHMRGIFHGFRIPGGVLLLALTLPLVCRATRVEWPTYGDRFVILAPVMLVWIRIGCFLNGCCFGSTTAVPWAVKYPAGSWAHYYQTISGLIPAYALESLPVHPLPLYFALSAAVTLAVLLLLIRRENLPGGDLPYVFYALFFFSMLLLEPFRGNRLSINAWIALPGTVLPLWILLGRSYARSRT